MRHILDLQEMDTTEHLEDINPFQLQGSNISLINCVPSYVSLLICD